MADAASDHAAASAQAIGRLLEAFAAGSRDVDAARRLARLLARYRVEPAPLVEAALRGVLAVPGFDAQPLLRIATATLLAQSAWKALSDAADKRAAISSRLRDRRLSPFDDAMLLAVLRRGICQSAALERILVALRTALLTHAAPLPRGWIGLAIALAQQAVNNEYAWPETPQEAAAIAQLMRAYTATSDLPEAERCIALCLMYRSPNELASCVDPQRVAGTEIATALVALLPDTEELAARAAIPLLATPVDPISLGVQRQYEENPYPRWLDLNPPHQGERREWLMTHCTDAQRSRFAGPLEILIAGCGTGRQAIVAALGYAPQARVLAIDLSAASLAYAARQAQRNGCAGLEFLQADILDLDRLDRRFDVIEASGVLHHLADPLAGWRRLADRLRPGGLMQVSLYSARARHDVVAARRAIAEHGLQPTREGIREFRRLVIEAPDDAADWRVSLRRFGDMFTTSGTRDLVFHVQEHRFTPRAIAAALDALGLGFAGLDVAPPVLAAYRRRFPDDAQALDLDCWDRFEAEHPNAFAGMITLWCRRRG